PVVVYVLSWSELHDCIPLCQAVYSLFFFNATATTELYTLSLHDALPISVAAMVDFQRADRHRSPLDPLFIADHHRMSPFTREYVDRKSTRLNSSHLVISYAVFCLKKKSIGLRHRLRDNYCPRDMYFFAYT